jgi:hypothetical protein
MLSSVTPLAILAVGALGGMVGAGLLTAVVFAAHELVRGDARRAHQPATSPLTAGTVLAEISGGVPDILQVAATFCQKVATGLFGTTLSRSTQQLAGVGWHLLYGAFWGAAYAALATSVALSPWFLAPALGFLVWAIGPGWLVPRMRLMLPPGLQPPALLAFVIVGHLAYGGAVGVVVEVLIRGR